MPKKDYLSVLLKSLLTGTFLYVWVLILFFQEYAWRKNLLPNAVLLVAILVIAGGIYCIRRRRGRNIRKYRLNSKQELFWLLAFSATLYVVQLAVIWNAGFRTSWDPGAVLYGARYAAQQDRAGIESMAYYFSVYPNNLLLVFFYAVILRINAMIGSPISNGTLLLAFVQCIPISFGGILLFRVARRFVTGPLAWLTYWFYWLLAGLSGWIMIPYSDSSGLLLPLFLFWLYLKGKEVGDRRKKLLFCLLLCAAAYVGYWIKPMTMIVLIAIWLVEIIGMIGKIAAGKKLRETGLHLYMLFAAAGFLAAALCVNTAVKSMDFPVVTETVLSWQHHMMLGANEKSSGGYNQEDFDFSTAFSDRKEQNRAELAKVKERLKEMGFAGYGRLFTRKAAKNYLDGSFGWGGGETFYTEVFPERANPLCPLLRSLYYDDKEDNLFGYYAQLRQFVWLAVLFGIVFAAAGKAALNTEEKVLVLAVLGLMLYLQIFEAHPRYLFTYVPLYAILSAIGFRNLGSRVYDDKQI